ncbi:MAG: hypothetical protein RMM17_08995 [Acidobacteriota bacterium]|nr:hypothetical protein [Blastocatellia bacterium]MDW8412803.1 hypothetical protein [Acidobacteriota bacterium]
MHVSAAVFIGMFIAVQLIVAVALIYQGFKIFLEELEDLQLWTRLCHNYRQVTQQIQSLAPVPKWLLTLSIFLIPGLLPLLLCLAVWRLMRGYETL